MDLCLLLVVVEAHRSFDGLSILPALVERPVVRSVDVLLFVGASRYICAQHFVRGIFQYLVRDIFQSIA